MVKLVKVPLSVKVNIKKPIKIPYKNPDGSVSITIEQETTEIENPEYFRLRDEYFNLVKDYRENQSEEFVGGMPATLQKSCLSELLRRDQSGKLVYGITIKVDGERYLMFLSSNGIVYFIDRALLFYYLDSVTVRLNTKPFLFDGELVFHKMANQYEYLIFDVLVYDNNPVIKEPYYRRYDIAFYGIQNILGDYFKNYSDLLVSLKKWFALDKLLETKNIYSTILNETNKQRSSKYLFNVDGLILQPFDTSYVPFGPWDKYQNVQFKWKPPGDLTIDFQIKIVGANEWQLLTKTGQNYNINQPSGPPVPAICIPTESNKRDYRDLDVAEFKFKKTNNPLGNVFTILRPRPEKSANSLLTIMSTMEVINNPFTLDSLSSAIGGNESAILNHYSKSKLILCILNGLFFNKSEINQITKIYDIYAEQRSTYELEFRILRSDEVKLNKVLFYYIRDFCLNNFKSTRNVTIDISNKNVRSVYSGNKLLYSEQKNKIKKYVSTNAKGLYNNLIFKLELSEELPSNVVITEKTGTKIRIKDRYSFEVNELWRIDITKVNSPGKITEEFEVECELLKLVPFDIFIKSFSDLYILILKNSSYC